MPSPSHRNKSTRIPSDQKEKDAYFRNLYTEPPDFKALATLDPAFAAVVTGREVDFGDPKAVVQLTKTLLKTDFGLEIELPEDRLCPPVPNRHHYILWIKDLLDSTAVDGDIEGPVVGLDIGTGASCIYPLLGCTQRPWSFIATDIDSKNLDCARTNIQLNNLNPRIKILPRLPSDPLIPLDSSSPSSLDTNSNSNPSTLTFTMTNPPFYSSHEAMLHSASLKSHPPSTACTGSPIEMVTPGGETAFVARLIEQSLLLRHRVQWYTAMLGFLTSVAHVVELLRTNGVNNYALGEIVQGRTRRWVVGWSFAGRRPKQSVARGMLGPAGRGLLPPVTECVAARVPLREGMKIQEFAEGVDAAIEGLEGVEWRWDGGRMEGVGRAGEKVWGRAWRRRKKVTEETKEEMKEEEKEEEKKEEKEDVFGFKVAVRVTRRDIEVQCRWLSGHDESFFESFRGFLKTTASQL